MFLQKFLTAPDTNKFSPRILFWFTLTMTFTAIYGLAALQNSFSSEYLIAEDARQHLFWMQRFLDPKLFGGDRIADFYQSITPPGVSFFYHLMATLGIDPFFLNKLIPVVLGLLTTGYCFAVSLQILPIPAAGFVASLLLSQHLWLQSELITATSKGFLYPTFMAFLYYLLRRSLLGVGISIALVGICYAPLMLVGAGILILRLFPFYNFRGDRSHYLLTAVGIGITFAVGISYLIQTSEFGPTITLAEARNLPEFYPDGRAEFFYDDQPWKYWFSASRTGIRLSFDPPMVAIGLLLPVLLRFPLRFPLAKKVNKDVVVLLQLLISSLVLFFASHALLFKLFLPSRYTVHSLRIIMAIAAGISLILIVDGIFQNYRKRKIIPVGVGMAIAGLLVFYPSVVWGDAFPRKSSYILAQEAALYQFFQKQPKDIVIATLSQEADNIPPFARRSVLVAWEYAMPYQVGYYHLIRQRATDLIRAQYTPNLEVVRDFINTYGVDFFLLDRDAFTEEYLSKNHWFKQWKNLAKEVSANLEGDTSPAIINTIKGCSAYQNERLVVLKAKCVKTIKNY